MAQAISRKNIWERLGTSGKSLLVRGLRPIPLPWWLGRQFRRALRLAHSAQEWSSEQATAYQLERLRYICRVAYEGTPFYRRLFDSVGMDPRDLKAPSDLASIPTINADTVREHIDEMCATSPRSMNVDLVSTAGTAGKPLDFYIGSGRSATEYAHLVASWERVGYTLGTPMAVFRGRVVGEDREGLRHECDPLLRHHYYSNFHMSDEDMRRYLEHVAALGPCFLHVYPSAVFGLAKFIRRTGARRPQNIRGIIAESENVYADQRALVERVFGCRYFSCYGHTEKLVLAVECEHSADYHVWPSYGYFELLDEDGRSVTTPGQRGQIVGTGFINTVMPFIRYRTGDYATYVGDHCEACGRQHTVIRDIQGHRMQEMLIAVDGSEISWTSLNMHDDTFLHVRQFQFYQDIPGRATLRVVPTARFNDQDCKRISTNLRHKLNGRLDFSVKVVERLPITRRGKAVYVDQHCPDCARATCGSYGVG